MSHERDAGGDLRRAQGGRGLRGEARAAAANLTGRDDRFDEVDKRLQHVEQQLGLVEQGLETLTRRVAALEEKIIALAQDVAVIRAELGLMKWMHGITIGSVLALLLKTFFG